MTYQQLPDHFEASFVIYCLVLFCLVIRAHINFLKRGLEPHLNLAYSVGHSICFRI